MNILRGNFAAAGRYPCRQGVDNVYFYLGLDSHIGSAKTIVNVKGDGMGSNLVLERNSLWNPNY